MGSNPIVSTNYRDPESVETISFQDFLLLQNLVLTAVLTWPSVKSVTPNGDKISLIGGTKMNRKYTDEMREETVDYYLESVRSHRKVSEELGIGINTLTRWIGQYRKNHGIP